MSVRSESGQADEKGGLRKLLPSGLGSGGFDQLKIVTALFLLIFAAYALLLPGFFTIGNLLTLIRTVSVLGILGLGMAIVVIGRGIDLSMIAALAVPTAEVLNLAGQGYGILPALAVGLAMAVVIGLLNGILVAYAEIPSLFTTLAVGIGVAGVGQIGLFQYDIVSWPAQLDPIAWIGRGTIYGIPYSVLAFGVSAVLVSIFLRRTRLGMFIYASGDNPGATRLTGIALRPVLVMQYVLSACIAFFAGMVMAASSDSMDTRIFNLTWIYDVILVVVLGGIGLSGGRGGVINVIIGTLLIGTIMNGLTIMNVSYEMQNLVRGLVLLVAVLADSMVNPRNEETAQQGDI
ncbi:MAG: ABC transporter permease [Pseudolabrys sp.]